MNLNRLLGAVFDESVCNSIRSFKDGIPFSLKYSEFRPFPSGNSISNHLMLKKQSDQKSRPLI